MDFDLGPVMLVLQVVSHYLGEGVEMLLFDRCRHDEDLYCLCALVLQCVVIDTLNRGFVPYCESCLSEGLAASLAKLEVSSENTPHTW